MIDLGELTIRSRSVSEMDNNVYLLTAKGTGVQLLIDAADDVEAIRDMLGEAAADSDEQTRLACIVTTHSHWDHVRALAQLVRETGARTAAGTEDTPDIEVPTDLPLEAGPLDIDGVPSLEVIKLRGHTPGSVALLYRDPSGPAHLFTGDSLFPGGVGNTFGNPENFTSLIADITERVFDVLPDDTLVHPGHGDGTTLGAERPHLQEWRERGW
ncbi:MBL fold metallo-hydrolase [Arthrobacter sp. JSM 101049]|uniref:MBL fold metallo-hydrolase n=1 Tax=Arthrobacter sp. JSM 101049 TaxID=929097 RepID=UPI0035622ED6